MSIAQGQAPDLVSTENQQLRARIRELEAQLDVARGPSSDLQALIDAIPIPIGIVDAACKYVTVNQTLAALHGVAPASHVGKGVAEIAPFLAGIVTEAVNTVLLTRQPIVGQELSLGTVCAPGNIGQWSVTWFPIEFPRLAEPVVGALIENVTERGRLEATLRSTKTALARRAAEFEALFRALPIGVGVSWDPSCRDIRINPAFAKILGIADEENASKSRQDGDDLPFRVYKNGQEVPAEDLPMQVAARTGSEVRDFVYELVRHDGVTLTEYGHATPLFDENGSVSGSIGVFLDFTELHRAQRELERANDELRRSNADLNHFAYGATHDLREPLRAIRIYSQLLARNVKLHSDPDLLECVNTIGDSAARMDRLLRDLMEYIQVATRRDQRTEEVDLNIVLRGVLSNLELSITETGAEISSPPLPTLPGHPGHFTHLFQNLIGNAIKYRSEDRPPRVRITVTQTDGVWKFSITDNGIGIEPTYTNRVFDLFQRLHGREIPGSGVGLAICQRVVQRHGGRIWVESTPGVGSTFYFTLPSSGTD